MRVLVVSAWESWRRGDGACLVLHAHLRELAARHELHVLCAGAPRREAAVPPGMLTVPGRWFGTSLPRPVDAGLRRLRAGGEPAHVGYVARPGLLRALDRTVRDRRPDLVHLFGWGTAGLHTHLGGVPAVHDAVDPWAGNLANRRRPGAHRLVDRKELERVRRHERQHYPLLAAVVVRTEEDAETLRLQVPGVRARVVPNGVDPGPPPGSCEAPVLGFLGSYDAQANVEAARCLVEEVLPLVRLTRPDASALLIGRDPPAEVRRLDAEVTGTVAQVRPHLERAAILVVAMTSGLGVRNKVLEAMAAGLPVTGTPLGLQGITPSLGVAPAADAAGLAAAAGRWLADPALRRAAAADNRRRAVEEFTWRRSAERLETVWREAL